MALNSRVRGNRASLYLNNPAAIILCVGQPFVEGRSGRYCDGQCVLRGLRYNRLGDCHIDFLSIQGRIYNAIITCWPLACRVIDIAR